MKLTHALAAGLGAAIILAAACGPAAPSAGAPSGPAIDPAPTTPAATPTTPAVPPATLRPAGIEYATPSGAGNETPPPAAAPPEVTGTPSVAAGQPTPGIRKDLTEAQHQDIDAQIAELRKSPATLAECARESGDTVPAPGSDREVDWYAAAAIKYAACAASKTTGVDWEGR